MRILITGHCGLVGNELCQQLATQGHVIIGCDDLSHNCIEVGTLPSQQNFLCSVVQLAYFTTSLVPLDLIIHCASPVGHARLTPEAQIAWQIISDTQAVLDLAERTGARLITFSSSEVLTYRGETDIRAQYSLGKLTSEAMVLGHPKVDARVVRPYNVTGRRQLADGGFVMARFRDAMLRGEPLTVFGTGEQVRHFTHVTDFARFVGLLVAAWPEKQVWSVFNPHNGATVMSLARLFCRSNTPNVISMPGSEALNNPNWRDSSDRTLDLTEFAACYKLGWEPQVSLEEIVRDHLSVKVEAAAND